MPEVKLTYFDIKARAELTRILLAAGGIPYEDNRVNFPPTHGVEQWMALKPKTPLKQLPVLEWDGVEISQSMAIARFVAKKAGLAGRNELEQALCDMVVDHVVDLEEKMYGCARSKTDEERKTAGAKLFDGGMQSFNETSAALLKKRGGKFFVGGEMTWADVAMAYALDTLMDPGRFEEIPGQDKRFKEFKLDPVLDDLRKRVNSHPGIKTWLQTRPKGARNI